MADILIRGMEMPRDCRECPFNVSIYTYDGGDETCALNAWDGYSEQPKITRHPDCPIVPLPEGHGRLGDLDALSKEFERLAFLDWNQKAAPYSWAYAYSEAQAAVDDSPTIVPAEGGTDNG